jgi:prepilin-type N-terminal cleavage/methylation domain-containing protein
MISLNGIGRRLKQEEGFTLVELLVVILLAGVISAAVIASLFSLTDVFNSQGARIQSQDDARTAINQVARFIRMATSSANNQTSQSNAIATATAQDLEFFVDIDGDGVSEKARYYLDNTTLKMQTVEPVWVTNPSPGWTYPGYSTDGIVIQQAVHNGGNPVFRFYKNVSGALVEFAPTTAAQRQIIVTVRVSLTVNARPDLAEGDVRLATDVQIRQRYQGGLQ